MRLAFLPAGLAALALCACEAPRGAVAPVSAEAARAPEPQLLETARFDSVLASAGPDAERLGADRDALAARAAALRARAAGLGSPLMPTPERARLAAGIATPPAIPAPEPATADPDAAR